MSGPVPKRSDQRRSSAPPGRPITKAPAGGRVPIACPEPEERWHPQAVKWYSALAESGQAQFYEPSDWAQAALIAEGISRMLYADRLSAQMFTAVNDASVRLLVTEGDRRRARIELDRAGVVVDADEDAAVTSMEAWREKLGG